MNKVIKMQPQYRNAVQTILQEVKMFSKVEITIAMGLIDIYLNDIKQKDYRIFVALNETDTVLGYLCYGPTATTQGTYNLYWIAVAKRFQNQGIGRLLLNFVESEVRRLKGRLLIIETSARTHYAATQQFYQRNDYIIAARIRDFYAPGDDRLIYVKYFPETENLE